MCDLAENIIRAPKVLKLLPRHKDLVIDVALSIAHGFEPS